MLNQRSDKAELLRIADAVALEKSIDKEVILSSMESAIQKAAKTKFGSENDIRAKIDRDSGDIGILRILKIVENPENSNLEISLDKAIELNETNKEKKIIGHYEVDDVKKCPSFDVQEWKKNNGLV